MKKNENDRMTTFPYWVLAILILQTMLLGSCQAKAEEQAATFIANTETARTPTDTITPTITVTPTIAITSQTSNPLLKPLDESLFTCGTISNLDQTPSKFPRFSYLCRNGRYHILQISGLEDLHEGELFVKVEGIGIKTRFEQIPWMEISKPVGLVWIDSYALPQTEIHVEILGYQSDENGEEEYVPITEEPLSTSFIHNSSLIDLFVIDITRSREGVALVLVGLGFGSTEKITLNVEGPDGPFLPVYAQATSLGFFSQSLLLGNEPLDGDYTIKVSNEESAAESIVTCEDGSCWNRPTSSEQRAAKEHYDLGRKNMRSGVYEDAVVHFQNVLDIDPNNNFALNELAWVLVFYLDRDYEPALDYAIRAVKFNPTAPNHDTLGLVYLRLEEYELALRHYNISLLFRPDGPYSLWGRGQVYMGMGDEEAALQDFHTYLEVAPDGEMVDEVREFISELEAQAVD